MLFQIREGNRVKQLFGPQDSDLEELNREFIEKWPTGRSLDHFVGWLISHKGFHRPIVITRDYIP